MKKLLAVIVTAFLLLSAPSWARSTKNKTIGVYALGNIQVLETAPGFDAGPGGGAFFDYRFNQRFSLTVEAWASTHDTSSGNMVIMALPAATIKLYFFDDESGKWDPYAGIGVGAYATSGAHNGVGLGGQIELGLDYYISDTLSTGLAGTFRSAAIIDDLGTGNNAFGMLPYTVAGKVGFHF
ncbi:outer membrane beta-barrel protein [bacterium]|nr:outer membrane beta-barrel protein [bacterium]